MVICVILCHFRQFCSLRSYFFPVKNIIAHIDGKPLKKYTPMMGQKFAMVTVTPNTGTGVVGFYLSVS